MVWSNKNKNCCFLSNKPLGLCRSKWDMCAIKCRRLLQGALLSTQCNKCSLQVNKYVLFSQVGVDLVKNLPVDKFHWLHLPWQLGDTHVGSALPDLSNVSATPDWRFKEKLSAFLLLTHLSKWHITVLCFQKSFSRVISNAIEGTGTWQTTR